MGTLDLSRAADNPAKRYRGTRMQMGRVLTDDDFNDNERIHDETDRRTLVDVIGPTGTPDDGFLVTNPGLNTANNKIDFVITAGALYLGGHRLEVSEDEHFQAQTDWLQQTDGDRPGLPAAGDRHDLVWVDAIEHEVTAVEDAELLEAGLDTGDTSARTRVTRRVRVLPGIASDNCEEGWAELLTKLAPEGTVTDDLELVPDATLTVGYETPNDPGDLCTPAGNDGYRGAENQAVRIQLRGPNTLTWGFDNASPLYRVQVGMAPNPPGGRRLVTMLTQPRDHAHWPLANQVVELLPWASVLPNGEKVAERSGFLTTVATSYDPDAGTLILTDAVPAGFGEAWKTRPDQAALGPEYLYMRVWDRGDDTSGPAVPFALATPESLPHTGITVTLAGTQLPADAYWIAAARPATPTQVVPWDLESGRAPHGYRRWIAPLAVIHWTAGSNAGTVVDDCRQPFLPLTRVRTCCTHTVGDGMASHGQFGSIQAAIDALPPEGGEVCVLAGRYEQRFAVVGRHDVTVHGCGARTRVVPPDDSAPAVTIETSTSVTISDLAIEAPAVVGVAVSSARRQEGTVRDIELRQLTITSSARGAIDCRHVQQLHILHNEVRLALLEREFGAAGRGTDPAIFASGTDLLVEQNQLHLVDDSPRLRTPLGGIQIGGGTTRVEVRRNRIDGGNGNGITLGSAVLVKGDDRDVDGIFDKLPGAIRAPWLVIVDANGCIHIVPGNPDDPDGQDPGVVIVSEGPVRDVRIVDNLIVGMGSNGIASLPFIRGLMGQSIVADLRIKTNRIVGNLGLELSAGLALLAQGFGGISLLTVIGLLLADNHIIDNGDQFDHPVCGVYVGRGADLVVHDNRIAGNGRVPEEPRFGLRGGLVITGVTPLPFGDRSSTTTSARIHDNVVLAPAGPALLLTGRGGFAVQDNTFGSTGLMSIAVGDQRRLEALVAEAEIGKYAARAGAGAALSLAGIALALAIQRLGGAAVLVVNTEISVDIGTRAVKYAALGAAVGSQADFDIAAAARPVPGPREYGPVLFHDNQVTLQLEERDMARSAILLATLDDVSMQGNQSTCATDGPVFANSLVLGWSTRVTGNRFREVPGRAVLSAMTVGALNTTAHNQATHCLRVVGVLTVDAPNQIHVEALTGRPCDQLTVEVPDEAVIGPKPVNYGYVPG